MVTMNHRTFELYLNIFIIVLILSLFIPLLFKKSNFTDNNMNGTLTILAYAVPNPLKLNYKNSGWYEPTSTPVFIDGKGYDQYTFQYTTENSPDNFVLLSCKGFLWDCPETVLYLNKMSTYVKNDLKTNTMPDMTMRISGDPDHLTITNLYSGDYSPGDLKNDLVFSHPDVLEDK
jgi:hypothetical protein